MRVSRLVWLAAILLPVAAPLAAQGTRADYERAEQFLPWNVRKLVTEAAITPHWNEGGDTFWYVKELADGREFWRVDPQHQTRVPAFDHARLASALSKAMGKEVTAAKLPFRTIDFTPQGDAIQFEVGEQHWKCSLKAYECAPGPPSGADRYETLSPDKKWSAYVEHYNLYIRNVATGQVVQLTSDGEKAYDYATPLPSSRLMVEQGTEDVREAPAVFWAPDSSQLITYRIDSRNAGRFTTIQFVPPHQLRMKAFTYVYPLPGEVLAQAAPIIFAIPSGKRIAVETEPIAIEFQDGPGFDWFKDSKRFQYLYNSRGWKRVELREVDAATGKQRVMLEEHADTYVDPGETRYEFVKDGAEILWTSERDGWNHLYLYNGSTSQLENQITQGQWVVRNIVHVDEAERRVDFLASGREAGEDPYQTHLYRVNFDGSGLQLLTPGNASHQVSEPKDGAFIVDSSSRPDLPGDCVVRRSSDGTVVMTLEKADASALQKKGWQFPEPFKGKAADNQTDIYGLIWRPSNLNPQRKYPIIEQIYTGPQAYFVPKTFSAYRAPEQSVAELGFVVVMVDGRGTTGRSRAFHEFSYHNLGGVFDDHVALIRQMAARYPYMDVTRVGIYGTSAGGYAAAHAILVHPEFYKVCVSISGDHDARLDKAWWNELYQGYPVGDDYAAQSNATLAGKLQGHLLLVHGDVDDNVNPVETMRMVDALIKVNKNFDMLFVPNMYHGEGRNLYLVRRRWDYFVEHLLGVTPPTDFRIEPPKDDFNIR